ncbi:DUF421 domain-containing protein [Brevibacterium atlanticum]|uniref:DUF421 domain-containing protein n=1 Tax=Brevibacterium atlanticum TaxID=2697563 RepID=UPI00141EC589|nr:YetF domain-containing protein [Brevibacterium atlanticum]
MDWMEYGLDGVDAVRVVVSCVIFYFGVILLLRVFGQRTLASLSSFDLAAIMAIGAIIGRSILGDTPTLAGGVLGLATLLILQALTGLGRRFGVIRSVVSSPAVVLMAGSEILADNLSRTHVDHDELMAKLRSAGIRNRDEVACAILESTGQISIIRRGVPIAEEMLTGVVGAERVPREG